MKKLILILVAFLSIIHSCHKNEKTATPQKTDTLAKKNIDTTVTKNQETEQLSGFPKTGKKASDFVSNTYEIQYEAEGDLNNDGLSDRALVLREKADTLADRTVLVILKNPDKTYRLDTTSDTVFPAEYTGDHYKIYDTEDISIEKGELNINLYATGPNGNLFSKFKYINSDLILTYIETYNMGAGSHQGLYYEVLKGKLTQEVTNTMEEEMPSKSKTFNLKKQRFLFKNVDPETVIRDAYNKIDSKDW
ncbi:hypothetical protein [Chryseobacterium polytrichastri]|uniref:Lipoprotein n=1 Tax=Chryseobacterium polytrichastri TaxID=1302687 RepID=A0A1M6SL30_9FLAO|nr:hypothetical protein [Chryseobacterium polytrichastri]SHK45415.1 hypothetical protein SAMN05444267_100456 [Chryseobacterium polytrichastri]